MENNLTFLIVTLLTFSYSFWFPGRSWSGEYENIIVYAYCTGGFYLISG